MRSADIAAMAQRVLEGMHRPDVFSSAPLPDDHRIVPTLRRIADEARADATEWLWSATITNRP